MVPVYHCLYEEGVFVLFCVIRIDRRLEASSISDHVTLDYVCDLKVLILGGSYPSATHRGQGFFFLFCFLLLFFFFGGGVWRRFCFCFLLLVFLLLLFFFWGGGDGWDEISSYPEYRRPKHACLRRSASSARFKSCSI